MDTRAWNILRKEINVATMELQGKTKGGQGVNTAAWWWWWCLIVWWLPVLLECESMLQSLSRQSRHRSHKSRH